jgi:hypothetical protein
MFVRAPVVQCCSLRSSSCLHGLIDFVSFAQALTQDGYGGASKKKSQTAVKRADEKKVAAPTTTKKAVEDGDEDWDAWLREIEGEEQTAKPSQPAPKEQVCYISAAGARRAHSHRTAPPSSVTGAQEGACRPRPRLRKSGVRHDALQFQCEAPAVAQATIKAPAACPSQPATAPVAPGRETRQYAAKYVLVGAGTASCSAMQAILDNDPKAKVCVARVVGARLCPLPAYPHPFNVPNASYRIVSSSRRALYCLSHGRF